MMISELSTIVSAFRVQGQCVKAQPFGGGHINDSFKLTFNHDGHTSCYLLQRINHHVFANVPALMSNIERVTSHIRDKLVGRGVPDVDRRVLTLVPTRDDATYHQDQAGSDWRMFLFIDGASSYDVVSTPKQAYAAARAYGRFQKQLLDLPGPPLAETIRDFHNTPKRFAAFEQALADDPLGRTSQAREQIDWLFDHRELVPALIQLRDREDVPTRITHNDTKLGNVLIDDQTQQGICVVDLDTVMPGLSLYDFGDLVRTSTSPVAEDEPDASKVTMQIDLFDALAQGYLDEARGFLTPVEIQSLPLAAKVMTLTIGMRFLTDFLYGDIYYKTQHPLHNLHRCRTQFALIDSMNHQQQAMRDCIGRLTNTNQ